MELRDVNLRLTKALPDGAAAVVSVRGIDTGSVGGGRGADWMLTAPDLGVAEIPNGNTMRYDIIMSANADLSAPVTYIAGAIVQTGAGGVGAGGSVYRFATPSTALRYFGLRITGDGAGDASGKSGLLEVLF